jgi:hypothetical protein
MLKRLVNNEMERMWKKVVMVQQRCYPGTWLEGLRKIMKISSQDSWGSS